MSESRIHWSRVFENTAFILGIIMISAKVTVEILMDASLIPHQEHSFFAVVLEFGRSTLLIAPKMIGRATAGQAWVSLGRRLSRKHPIPEEEGDK